MAKNGWTLEPARDVLSYLYLASSDLKQKIKLLKKGIPSDAHFMEIDEKTGLPIWRWIEARHWITFAVDEERAWIYILNVESTTVE